MPRIRTIKPEFWTDDKIVELSFPARLLFIGLWNFCDDWGRMEYKPKSIKLRIFPADNVDIEELLGELENLGLIRPYEVEGKKYFVIPNFRKHQNKVSLKSKPIHPAPPWENGGATKKDVDPPVPPPETGSGNDSSGTFKKFLEHSRNFKNANERKDRTDRDLPFEDDKRNTSLIQAIEGFQKDFQSVQWLPAQRAELRLLENSRIFLPASRIFYLEKEQGNNQVNNSLSQDKLYQECKNEREDFLEKEFKENTIFSEFKRTFGLDYQELVNKYGEEQTLKAADKMLYMKEKGHEILDARAYFEKVVKNPGDFPSYWERKKIKDEEREAHKLAMLERQFWNLLRRKERDLEKNMSDKEREHLYLRAKRERITKYGGMIREDTVLSIIIRTNATKEILDKYPQFIPVVPKETLKELGYIDTP